MPSPEQELPAPSATPAHERPERGGRFGASLPAFVMVAAVVGLFAVLLARANGSVDSTVPANWQTYRDPLGLFTTRLPPDWTAQADTSTASFGDRTGSATESEEHLTFTDPS